MSGPIDLGGVPREHIEQEVEEMESILGTMQTALAAKEKEAHTLRCRIYPLQAALDAMRALLSTNYIKPIVQVSPPTTPNTLGDLIREKLAQHERVQKGLERHPNLQPPEQIPPPAEQPKKKRGGYKVPNRLGGRAKMILDFLSTGEATLPELGDLVYSNLAGKRKLTQQRLWDLRRRGLVASIGDKYHLTASGKALVAAKGARAVKA